MIIRDYKTAAKLLIEGKIGLIPADTVYGISCVARNRDLVERIYDIKNRDRDKPFIVLLPNSETLSDFGINNCNSYLQHAVNEYWPGPASLVIDCPSDNFAYLHRGKKSLAFRVPNDKKLLGLLTKTGPIVSTSANISDKAPVTSVDKALEVFGNKLDFYFDVGKKEGNPSKIIRVTESGNVLIRE